MEGEGVELMGILEEAGRGYTSGGGGGGSSRGADVEGMYVEGWVVDEYRVVNCDG